MSSNKKSKVTIAPEHWDNIFAPSSALVMITTVNSSGAVNAATYGTCVRVAHGPVHLAFTCTEGTDTYSNIQATGEFVVNLVPFDPVMLGKVLTVGLPWRKGVNELEKADLTPLSAGRVTPPRIAECYAHFEMKVEWTHKWINRMTVVGAVVEASVNADCMDGDGFLIWENAKPAHFCGGRYKDQFVPAHQPITIDWDWQRLERLGVSSADFRPLQGGIDDPVLVDAADWRDVYRSRVRT